MIVIVDYDMGNVGSIVNMLKRVGAEATISSDVGDIARASKLILPGVGAFDTGMANIERKGLRDSLEFAARDRRIPVLGICLGMQLLTEGSEEGQRPGLGWIDGETVKFRFEGEKRLKIPHMGWNEVQITGPSAMFSGLEDDAAFYFVHSYYVRCRNEGQVTATSHYGHDFVSAVGSQNIWGTQFHPEKSHRYGMRLLSNFAGLPAC